MLQIDLIEKCKKNDRKAQMRLYDQYCDGMFCVAMRFLKNTDDAQDAVQEAFIKAFQKIHQFKAEVTFGAWLKRIVVNKSIDFLKSKREYLISLDESYMQIADDEDDWTVEENISVDMVKKAIDKLPDKYKYVVMLYLIEGYDHEEISEILKIAQTTSRTQLMRGKQRLRELLKYQYDGTGH
ncbi:sigma-70 family RNA polymerase sigma factor [Galbibacter sp. EGI 63066]|uniref:RNA polymerase sigma factor n=1 Tax=Galbibacter sp. EGI 63066 TaxID=2993559 RepID=UPI0022492AD0|nr:sigma-70 family RNA polymerase sigma factor [Galbibacter sp. EGI 63066]MCX2680210.1 sigma-70 family RNA polymerase sigma factor [Galbibacter sp. EGI 63066]